MQNDIAHLSTQYWIAMEDYCSKAEWKYLRISIGRCDLWSWTLEWISRE